MNVVFPRCAGLDVHKKTVVACVLIRDDAAPRKTIQTFGTATADLRALRLGSHNSRAPMWRWNPPAVTGNRYSIC
jgi:hypothetical protein